MVVRVGVDLREPDDLLGIHGLAVYHCRDLPVAPSGVKADAAAVRVPAYGLRRILGRGQRVRLHDLERTFKDVRHVVPVELPHPARAVDGAEIVVYPRVAADIDLVSALHPQHGFHKAVDVIAVGGVHFRRAVYARLDCGHLAARALQRDADGLLCAAEKRLVELVQRDELRIQLRQILDIQIDSEKLHGRTSVIILTVLYHKFRGLHCFFMANLSCACPKCMACKSGAHDL